MWGSVSPSFLLNTVMFLIFPVIHYLTEHHHELSVPCRALQQAHPFPSHNDCVKRKQIARFRICEKEDVKQEPVLSSLLAFSLKLLCALDWIARLYDEFFSGALCQLQMMLMKSG